MQRPTTGAALLSVQRLDRLEYWLDRAFRVPGTSMRFGLDGLLGLFPVVGDASTALLSGLFVTEAARLGARRSVLARMLWNVILDAGLGSIPLVGDLFDFAHKANSKNLRLLREEMERIAAPPYSR